MSRKRKLEDLCAAAVRKHDLARDDEKEMPRTLAVTHFGACCFGDDLDTAFRLRHHECVLKRVRDLERLFSLICSEKNRTPEFILFVREFCHLLPVSQEDSIWREYTVLKC